MMYIITHKENSEFNEQRNELIGGGVRRGAGAAPRGSPPRPSVRASFSSSCIFVIV